MQAQSANQTSRRAQRLRRVDESSVAPLPPPPSVGQSGGVGRRTGLASLARAGARWDPELGSSSVGLLELTRLDFSVGVLTRVEGFVVMTF